MPKIFDYGYCVTGSAADLFTVCSFNASFPFDLQRSFCLPRKRSVFVQTTVLSRCLYYINTKSNRAAFISNDGETMFFNNQLAKIFVCSGQVWAIFYRPNGKIR